MLDWVRTRLDRTGLERTAGIKQLLTDNDKYRERQRRRTTFMDSEQEWTVKGTLGVFFIPEYFPWLHVIGPAVPGTTFALFLWLPFTNQRAVSLWQWLPPRSVMQVFRLLIVCVCVSMCLSLCMPRLWLADLWIGSESYDKEIRLSWLWNFFLC